MWSPKLRRPPLQEAKGAAEEETGVPTLTELGYTDEPTSQFKAQPLLFIDHHHLSTCQELLRGPSISMTLCKGLCIWEQGHVLSP